MSPRVLQFIQDPAKWASRSKAIGQRLISWTIYAPDLNNLMAETSSHQPILRWAGTDTGRHLTDIFLRCMTKGDSSSSDDEQSKPVPVAENPVPDLDPEEDEGDSDDEGPFTLAPDIVIDRYVS